MTFWAVAGLIIAVVIALAGWYDYRLRRRGGRFKLTGKDAYQNRVDSAMRADPLFPGGPKLPQKKSDSQ